MDNDKKFSTNAIHSGTYQADGAVNTPVYLSSTYRLNEERYAGWAAGAQHTLLYARISSVNSEAVVFQTIQVFFLVINFVMHFHMDKVREALTSNNIFIFLIKKYILIF